MRWPSIVAQNSLPPETANPSSRINEKTLSGHRVLERPVGPPRDRIYALYLDSTAPVYMIPSTTSGVFSIFVSVGRDEPTSIAVP